MSVEEGKTVDLSEVTPKIIPSKKVPTKKAAPRKVAPAPSLSEADIEARVRAKIEAEIEARIRAEIQAESASTTAYPDDQGIHVDADEAPIAHVAPSEDEVVIHFVDDGFTFQGKMWYRGQELSLNPAEHPWVNMPRNLQIREHGKQVFARGPWPYAGYDLTDPSLTEEDKARILRATR